MHKILSYGIVGCGSFGKQHIRGLSFIDNVNITALCDVHIDKCEKLKEEFELDVKCYSDYNEMLSENNFDIVVVATSDKEHKGATVAALRSGCNVMCEKPMALFTEDCAEMIKASKESGKLLMVGQVCRYAPGFVKAKEMVEAGVIGDLFFAESEYAHDYKEARGVDDWRVDKDREPVIGGACHAIDLLRWIAGDPVETSAYSNHKMLLDWPVNDATVAIMKFPDNVIGKVFASVGCKRDYTMRTVLYGTKGTIIVDNTSPSLTLYLEKSNKNGPFADGFFGDGSERNIKHLINVSVNSHNVSSEHKMMQDAVVNGAKLLTTGEEGAKTVAVCRAVVESAKTGKAVKINYNISC